MKPRIVATGADPTNRVPGDAEELRHEMEMRGVTGRELARRARVSEATVSHALNGRRIHPAKRHAIVAALYAIEPLARPNAVTLAELPEYARVAQVAELLGLSRSELYRMVEAGEMPATRVGETAVRIPKTELLAWLRARTTPATPTVNGANGHGRHR
jgi:excisionase family DNA binding protein